MSTAQMLQDEWLLSYAAGALSPARSLMVASQSAYHDEMQQKVADAEALGGQLLQASAPATVDPVQLERLLARIDAQPALPEVRQARGWCPEPLAQFIDTDPNALQWRFMGPGMSNLRLWDGPNDERLWLLRARGGVEMPEHGHSGDEWTLVLKGAFETAAGRFGVGDMDIADERVEHQPLIEDGEECICLVLTAGPIRFRSLAARLIQPFIGL